ncbi:J domain-containing protein, partial [Myxococcota bacterium]|nr:J domain-containing protein [Myxococcota bacterium]
MPPKLVCVHGSSGFPPDLWRFLKSTPFSLVSVDDSRRGVIVAQEQSADGILLSPEYGGSDRFLEMEMNFRASMSLDRSISMICCQPAETRNFEPNSSLDQAPVIRISASLSPEEFVRQINLVLQGDAKGSFVKGDRKAIPIAGDLRDTPFGRLLADWYRRRVRGVALIDSGKKRKAIEFRHGCPVAVQSNLLSECLGHRLMESRRLSRENWEESVRRLRNGEGPQGKILIEMGVMDPANLQRELNLQAEAKILAIFEWRAGRYRFEAGKKLGSQASRLNATPPSRLIRHAAHRLISQKEIDLFLARYEKSNWQFVVDESAHERSDCEQDHWIQLEKDLDQSCCLGEYLKASESTRRALYAAVMMGFHEESDSNFVSVAEPGVSRDSRSEVRTTQEQPEQRAELLEWARKLRGQDAYSILGLPNSLDDCSVDEAYTRLAKSVRPDRFRDS